MEILLKLYANLNLGDDLFLKIILERYPNVKFVLPAPNTYKNIFNRYNNLEIIEDNYNFDTTFFNRSFNYLQRRFFLNSYIKRVEEKFTRNFCFNNKQFDGFVSIGGSIFMQQKLLPVYSSIIYYKMAQKYCKNTFFLGCNFGPYNDPKFYEEYKGIFDKANDVCFREELSWSLFSDFESVRYQPDIVFGLQFPKSKIQNKTVGFSIVSPRNGVDNERYYDKYAELIEFYQKKDYQISLFSFCENQGDGATIDRILSKIKNKENIRKVVYNGDIESFLNIYSSMEQMYCGRFHAMILSMIFDQKIYPIIYSNKMLNVLNDINYKGENKNVNDFLNADPDNLYDQISINSYDIQKFKSMSDKQFQKLDLYLKK